MSSCLSKESHCSQFSLHSCTHPSRKCIGLVTSLQLTTLSFCRLISRRALTFLRVLLILATSWARHHISVTMKMPVNRNGCAPTNLVECKWSARCFSFQTLLFELVKSLARCPLNAFPKLRSGLILTITAFEREIEHDEVRTRLYS